MRTQEESIFFIKKILFFLFVYTKHNFESTQNKISYIKNKIKIIFLTDPNPNKIRNIY